MFTLKVDHRFSDRWTLSGFYLYNKTDEPGSGIMPPDFLYIENQAEFFPAPPASARAGDQQHQHPQRHDRPDTPLRLADVAGPDRHAAILPGLASLGFSSDYVNAINEAAATMFPELLFDDIDDVGGWGGVPQRWTGPTRSTAR